jgi:hypothetical protein
MMSERPNRFTTRMHSTVSMRRVLIMRGRKGPVPTTRIQSQMTQCPPSASSDKIE